jgi:hypothetical protein
MITGWLLFIVSSVVYLLTLEPTVSFWDCGEFILSSFRLQVGHPPGAPLFLMMGRIATLFAGGDTSKVALMMNALSALCSGFAIMFLFWTITHLARRVYAGKDEIESRHIPAVILFQILSGFRLSKVNFMPFLRWSPDSFSGACLNGRKRLINHIREDG